MKKLIALACLGLAFAVSAPAFAGAQQDKMKGCNIEAKGMKADERKAFMSKCLKKDYVLKSDASAAAPAAKAPDAKASCEAKAVEKKLAGAAKSSFMKKCEADKSAAAPAAKASDASAACEAKAAEKKLAGAAKSSFVKKCVADAGK